MFPGRLDYISDLNEFVSDCKLKLNDVLDKFGWQNPAGLKKDEKSVLCPNDSNHMVLEKNLDKHIVRCSLRRDGYCEEDVFFPPANENGRHVVTVDEDMLEGILKDTCSFSSVVPENIKKRSIPQTSDRLISDFTSEERRAIYDYVVKNTSHGSESSLDDINLKLNKTQDDSKPKTLEELIAAERDAKRRRIRYRSKKVHTGRKTQTEVLKEVIQSQMEGYEEWLCQQGFKVPVKEVDTSSLPVDSSVSDGNCVVSDAKHNYREIVRDWDDWNYYYKGNPHKRYLKIIEEERVKERKNTDIKSSRSNTSERIRDDRRCGKDNDRRRRDEEYCMKRKRGSKERERSTENESFKEHYRYRDKCYKKVTENYKDYEHSKSRNNEERDRYRGYSGKTPERNKNYDRDYSDRKRTKFHDRDRNLHSYKEEKYKGRADNYSVDSLSSSISKDYIKNHHHLKKHKSKKQKHKSKKRKHKTKSSKNKKKLKSSESDSGSSKIETDNSESS